MGAAELKEARNMAINRHGPLAQHNHAAHSSGMRQDRAHIPGRPQRARQSLNMNLAATTEAPDDEVMQEPGHAPPVSAFEKAWVNSFGLSGARGAHGIQARQG